MPTNDSSTETKRDGERERTSTSQSSLFIILKLVHIFLQLPTFLHLHPSQTRRQRPGPRWRVGASVSIPVLIYPPICAEKMTSSAVPTSAQMSMSPKTKTIRESARLTLAASASWDAVLRLWDTHYLVTTATFRPINMSSASSSRGTAVVGRAGTDALKFKKTSPREVLQEIFQTPSHPLGK